MSEELSSEQIDDAVAKMFAEYPIVPDKFIDLSTGNVVKAEDIYGRTE